MCKCDYIWWHLYVLGIMVIKGEKKSNTVETTLANVIQLLN